MTEEKVAYWVSTEFTVLQEHQVVDDCGFSLVQLGVSLQTGVRTMIVY